MTYDAGRRGGERSDGNFAGGGRQPVLRNEFREPLRAQRDPLADAGGRVRSNRDDHQRWRKQSWLSLIHI